LTQSGHEWPTGLGTVQGLTKMGSLGVVAFGCDPLKDDEASWKALRNRQRYCDLRMCDRH